MADLIDVATDIAQQHLDVALSGIQPLPANSLTECIDCGEPIGVARKMALPHAVRCVSCQEDKERTKV